MRVIDNIVRSVVGALFIFSGLVKLNDPVGTEIKLEEYFNVFADDFAEFFAAFAPYSLELGFFLIILEIVIGVAVLINYRMKITMWVLLFLILFFTFLTFYSAYFDKVTDCGCFGDAIPLNPWQSFAKDVILIILIGYLFYRRNKLLPSVKTRTGNFVVAGSAVLSLLIGIYAVRHLPYIDFRAYSIGDNIQVNMQPEEAPVFEYVFRKEGEMITSQEYLLESEGYEYVDYQVLNPDKSTPKITDYNLWNDEAGDYTEETFKGNKLMIIIVDASKANGSNMGKINQLIDSLGDEVDPLAVTSSDYETFESFRHEHQLAISYFYADAVVLKAMIRSNPGIILLQEGTVKGKWHHNDVPSAEEVRSIIN